MYHTGGFSAEDFSALVSLEIAFLVFLEVVGLASESSGLDFLVLFAGLVSDSAISLAGRLFNLEAEISLSTVGGMLLPEVMVTAFIVVDELWPIYAPHALCT